MNWVPNKLEISKVSSLNGPKRYDYLIKKVADDKIVWSLWKDNGWALAEDSEKRILVPIWPHSTYATLSANGDWAGYDPRSITVDVWLNRWIPGMQKDNRLVLAFPVSADKGVVVDPERIGKDLLEEMERYE